MKIKSLREIIHCSVSDSDDTRSLNVLLATIDDADVSDFVSAISSGVTKVATALAKQRKAAEESEATIAQLVEELERTKLDNAAFKAVVDRMKSTRAIKLGDATEIANRYLGDSRAFKSKPEAAKAILNRQISEKRAQNRRAGISGIF